MPKTTMNMAEIHHNQEVGEDSPVGKVWEEQYRKAEPPFAVSAEAQPDISDRVLKEAAVFAGGRLGSKHWWELKVAIPGVVGAALLLAGILLWKLWWLLLAIAGVGLVSVLVGRLAFWVYEKVSGNVVELAEEEEDDSDNMSYHLD